MDPKDRAYLLRRLRGRFVRRLRGRFVFVVDKRDDEETAKKKAAKNEADKKEATKEAADILRRIEALLDTIGPIPAGKIEVRDDTSPKGASIEEIAGKLLKEGTRLVSRRVALAEALERIDLLTKLHAVDRGEQVLRPEAAKILRGLRGGPGSVDDVVVRGELRDLLVAKIERDKPLAFSGGDWLDETVERLRLLKWYANQVLVPLPPTGRPVALPPGVIPEIQYIWRGILNRRGGRTVGVPKKPDAAGVEEDNIPRGPLIEFTGACLGFVGFDLSADAINSHLARSKWSKPSAKVRPL